MLRYCGEMARTKQVAAGLEVNEDRAWQEKFWTAQRIAWIVMALIILAALAGLTGKGGPFASKTVNLGVATLEYPRITRWQSDEQVTVRLAPSAPETVEIILSREFVELLSVESIEPEPDKVKATATGHHYTLETTGSGERVIALNVRAMNPVLAQPVSVAVGDSHPARLTITVLP